MESFEIVLLRIEYVYDTNYYINTIRTWMKEMNLNGRFIRQSKINLLIFEGISDNCNTFLNKYKQEPVDIIKNKPCCDRFYDILGRKYIKECNIKNFLEINVLDKKTLENLLVDTWKINSEWIFNNTIEENHTKSFLKWKEVEKVKRKEKRKQTAKKKTKTKE